MNDRPAGLLFVITAPSGAGKTSLIDAVMREDPSLKISVSYTTRAPRPGEKDGVDYHFVDVPTFDGMINCTTLNASVGVISPSYTPGAGNIW